MRIEYVSDILNKRFNSEKELLEAEKQYKEEQKKVQTLKNERAKRKKEVDDAMDKAYQLFDAYVKDYGTYYTRNSIFEDIIKAFENW